MNAALALVLSTAVSWSGQLSYWFELWGIPVGVVTLRRDEAEYEYRSRLVFTREADRTSVQRGSKLKVDGAGKLASGEVPESLWLSARPPSLDCVKVVEELGGRTGDSCVLRREGDIDEGTVLGMRYRARYGPRGVLSELKIGESRFVMLEGSDARAPRPPDVFGGGVPVAIGRGALRLVPAASGAIRLALAPQWTPEEAQAVAEEVHSKFAEKRPTAADFGEEDDSAGCLGHVRTFVTAAKARGKSVAVVQGLLALPGEDRAFPHVWVRVGLKGGRALDLDPTSLDDVLPSTHLALAAGARTEEAGALWLRVLRGGHRVERGP